MMEEYIADILKVGRIKEEVISDKTKLDKLIRFSRNNELFYYVLSLAVRQGSPQGPISRLWDQQENLSKEIAGAVVEISRDFGRRGLRFFAMKTFRSYPYADDDLDLVGVDKNRIKEYISSLRGMGYVLKWDRSILREPGKRFYIKKEKDNVSNPLKIHLHSSVSWNGVEFLDAARVWKRARAIYIMGGEIRIPAIEDEFLIISAHAAYENTYITAGELLHLRNLLSETKSIDTDYIIDASKRYNWNLALRHYLLYADLYYHHLTGETLLNQKLRQRLDVSAPARTVIAQEGFPYFLPVFSLLAAYTDKIMKDFYSLNLCKIPREVLSFGVISWLLRLKNNAKFARGYL